MRYKQTLREEYLKDVQQYWKNAIVVSILGSILLANCIVSIAAVEMLVIVYFALNPGIVVAPTVLVMVSVFIIGTLASHTVFWINNVKARTKERIDNENRQILAALSGTGSSQKSSGCGHRECI